jgi:hypothetical protein
MDLMTSLPQRLPCAYPCDKAAFGRNSPQHFIDRGAAHYFK